MTEFRQHDEVVTFAERFPITSHWALLEWKKCDWCKRDWRCGRGWRVPTPEPMLEPHEPWAGLEHIKPIRCTWRRIGSHFLCPQCAPTREAAAAWRRWAYSEATDEEFLAEQKRVREAAKA